MRKTILSILTVTLICQTAHTNPAGVTTSVDIKAVESAKSAYFDFVLKCHDFFCQHHADSYLHACALYVLRLELLASVLWHASDL